MIDALMHLTTKRLNMFPAKHGVSQCFDEEGTCWVWETFETCDQILDYEALILKQEVEQIEPEVDISEQESHENNMQAVKKVI